MYAPLFQPFINALLSNTYSTKPGIADISGFITSKDIDSFLRNEALIASPAINSLPVSRKKKLDLIDHEAHFKNYTEIKRLFENLPKGNYERSKIMEYDLNVNNELILPEHITGEIENKHTVYADTPEQKELFDRAAAILAQAKEFLSETGVNLFSPVYPVVAGVNDLTGRHWQIEPHGLKKQLSAKGIEHVSFLIANNKR
jgi:hypothetical protein